ncbi:hypothetical protein ACJIZ3_022002 [Penstemon smallii]|uniref:Myb-like domain-containing protein n=1 Tax=Penstemon smallii TaxID=265156 RepID=A0ABD3SP13_9LAMI
MSSATTPPEAPETVQKAPRKFPPPCWTQEETLVLIDSYRERWYALRRGYLRTADWDAVAETVTSRCPGASPAKTSAQCRHKMEKLRQRYRAEKQRALSYPYPAGRYFSSWFFFDYMEAMENGTAPPKSGENSGDGSGLKSFLDHNILKLKLKANNDSDPNLPDYGLDNSVKATKRSKISSDYYVGKEEEEDTPPMNTSRRRSMNGIPTPPLRSKPNNSARMFNNFEDTNNFGKFDRRTQDEEFWAHNIKDSRGGLNSGGVMNGSKRGRNALEEMVSSIKLLGEGFMRMERAKMEMAREMEATRMEMEMKRNEMLLESQRQIVDAFVKGMFEMKANKKVKADSDET